jgi:tetratricopeptide (TPR) repeat protein
MEKTGEYLVRPTVTRKGVVRAWEETVSLPTYETGKEEKNPVFLEKRVYQGSCGAVYPFPVVETVGDLKRDMPYRAFFLENEYLKIMILPQLGGRVQMAYDKIRQRHFVYYNRVIKPALVGLAGPWISGGIEFNWPQHHRPSTFMPVDCATETNGDGSITVWCSEVERMSHTKGMHGFTLYPGRAYLEVSVKLYNRTPFPQSFLWWANPAVEANGHYYSVFPPDVHAVFDHGRRDVSAFPVATGVYYKHDYSAGVDISRYENIPVPTSYMAVPSEYDFVGGYDEHARAGLLHVADHHVAPGKKQWTWGCGDFGRAWDENLTDEDGPYVELMTGVYTDNQPDFSWLQAGEEKSWVQYFMPYAEVGRVKNATREAVVNVETDSGETKIVLYTTGEYRGLRVMLYTTAGDVSTACESLPQRTSSCMFDSTVDVTPENPWTAVVASGDARPEDLKLEVRDENGRLLIACTTEKHSAKPLPEPARPAKRPNETESVESLFLTGLHLEQYRHATCNPMDYYFEALRREPNDARCNNAVGLWLMRRGQFARAEEYFRRAVATLTERNPNPYDGEPYYNLGHCLKMQYRADEAYAAFFKSAWNAAMQDAAYLALAQIETERATVDGYLSALEKTERSLMRNTRNHRARHLKCSLLRKLGRVDDALRWIDESLRLDMFNLGCRFEKHLITGDENILSDMERAVGDRTQAYTEYALDFAAAGMYGEGERLLQECVAGNGDSPMLHYTLGYFASRRGDSALAAERYAVAARMSPDRCFPSRVEEVNILRDAMRTNPADAKAPYYLGNFLYAAHIYPEAIECWERSLSLDGAFPTVRRNIALAYFNKKGEKAAAREMLETAFALDQSDARVLMELDGLYRKTGMKPAERLAFLERHSTLVEQRDDLCVERVTLYNLSGEHGKARELTASRRFHPWEGGEGRVTGQYVRCCVELAKRRIAEKRYSEALVLLHETDVYPRNLGEGKLPTTEENEVDYYKGVACRGTGDVEQARLFFTRAACGSSEPVQAFFYNDAQPEGIFYQGEALRALGEEEQARSRFEKLRTYGEQHLDDDCRIDYFAVSLPDLAVWDEDLNFRNRIHCLYMTGLGHLGLGDPAKAREFLTKVMEMDPNHHAVYMMRQ